MTKKSDFIIPWGGRSSYYTSNEINAAIKVMKEGSTLTQGKYLKEFEKEFDIYNNTNNSYAVSNGTTALELAATLCKFKPGDEVIIPSHTFSSSATPFGKLGARIIWADINPDTLEISVDSIKELITSNTKAIVPVHLYGLMADMKSITDIAKEHELLIVEDVAQAPGAEQNGKRSGSFGDFATFSFDSEKHIPLGEGGMITVKSDELAESIPGLRYFGTDYHEDKKEYWYPSMRNIILNINDIWPTNFALSEIQCAIGTEILKRFNQLIDIRIKRAKILKQELNEYNELKFQEIPNGYKHVYLHLVAKYTGKKTNHDFIRMMANKYKIQMATQYNPLYRYNLYREMGYGWGNCPVSEDFYDNMVSFPTQTWISDEMFNYMIESTIKTIKKLGN